jgi:hypothetical protein
LISLSGELRASARGEDEDFLRERRQRTCCSKPRPHGIGQNTLRSAAKKMGVKPKKNGFQAQWWWQRD